MTDWSKLKKEVQEYDRKVGYTNSVPGGSNRLIENSRRLENISGIPRKMSQVEPDGSTSIIKTHGKYRKIIYAPPSARLRDVTGTFAKNIQMPSDMQAFISLDSDKMIPETYTEAYAFGAEYLNLISYTSSQAGFLDTFVTLLSIKDATIPKKAKIKSAKIQARIWGNNGYGYQGAEFISGIGGPIHTKFQFRALKRKEYPTFNQIKTDLSTYTSNYDVVYSANVYATPAYSDLPPKTPTQDYPAEWINIAAQPVDFWYWSGGPSEFIYPWELNVKEAIQDAVDGEWKKGDTLFFYMFFKKPLTHDWWYHPPGQGFVGNWDTNAIYVSFKSIEVKYSYQEAA